MDRKKVCSCFDEASKTLRSLLLYFGCINIMCNYNYRIQTVFQLGGYNAWLVLSIKKAFVLRIFEFFVISIISAVFFHSFSAVFSC